MAEVETFSDLLTRLVAAHDRELKCANDRFESLAAKVRSVCMQVGETPESNSLRMAVEPVQEGKPTRYSSRKSIGGNTNGALLDVVPSPFAKPKSSPSGLSSSPSSNSGRLARSSSQQSGFSSQPHILKPRWSREAIWGIDHVNLPEAEGARSQDLEDGVLTMINGIEIRISGWLGCSGCVLFPNSNFRTLWDMISLCLIIIDILTLPFIFAFNPEPTTSLLVLEWISLLFWTTDMAQGPFLGYFEQGDYITDRMRVVKHYLKTWFIVDVLVVCPEWLVIILGSSDGSTVNAVAGLGKLVKSIRVMRVLRLLRLPKIKRLVEVLYDTSKNEFSFAMLSVIHLIAFVLVLNHLVACAWYAVGIGGFHKNSWIKSIEQDGEEMTIYYLYLTSLHWSLTQFTPAAMKVSATNDYERLFSIIVLFFAMIVFSSFVGSITNHITKLRSLRSDSTKQLWLLRRFLKEHRVCENLAQRIHKFVEHKLSEEAGKLRISEIDILSKLSSALSDELAYALHSVYVQVHPFFNFSVEIEVVMHRLCRGALRSEHSAKDELVFSLGDEGKKMFVIQSGEIEYSRVGFDRITITPVSHHHEGHHHGHHGNDEEKVAMVQWVAEAVLWTAWRHRGKLVVCPHHPVEFLTLDPELFFKVMSQHPRSWLYATVYGEHFVDYLNTVPGVTDVICDDHFYYEATRDAAWVSDNPWAEITRANTTIRRVSSSQISNPTPDSTMQIEGAVSMQTFAAI